MARRIPEMDMARGLATIAVVTIHISADPLIEAPKAGGVNLVYLALNVAARFAVPMFVLLSGMGLTLSDKRQEGYIAFMRRRLSKLVPAYVFWSVIYSLTYSEGPIGFNRGVSITRIISDLLTGAACFHLYFIPLIIQFYLLYPLLRRLFSGRIGVTASVLITTSLMLVSRYVDTPAYLSFLFDDRNPLMFMCYFAMGMWLADNPELQAVKKPKTRAIITMLFLACLATMCYIVRRVAVAGNDIDEGLEALGPIIIVYTALFALWVWSLQWKNPPVTRTLDWISSNSYMIYLAHPFVLICYLWFYPLVGIPSNGWAYGVFAMVSVMIGSIIFAWIHALKTRMVARLPGRTA